MAHTTSSRRSSRAGTLARRAWGRVGDHARRLLTGRAFIPVSVVLASALLLLTGVQVARLSGAARAAGWFAPHEALTFSGPGLDGAPTTLQASILGAVAAPGAYALPADARITDLVAAAGGLLPTANAAALDEAASIAEGQQVYVPYVGQAPASVQSTLVNINTASAEELHAALGITTPTAQHIMAYRDTHGPFTALSQLLLVPISRTTFDRIRYLVTI